MPHAVAVDDDDVRRLGRVAHRLRQLLHGVIVITRGHRGTDLAVVSGRLRNRQGPGLVAVVDVGAQLAREQIEPRRKRDHEHKHLADQDPRRQPPRAHRSPSPDAVSVAPDSRNIEMSTTSKTCAKARYRGNEPKTSVSPRRNLRFANPQVTPLKEPKMARNQRDVPAAARAAGVELAGVTKQFATPAGTSFTAVRDVTLTVEPGQFCAIVGPTGCGKSTTLSMVAGLDRPSAGEVSVAGRPVNGIVRGTSFMFQSDALLPWKSVLSNVALGPVFRG